VERPKRILQFQLQLVSRGTVQLEQCELIQAIFTKSPSPSLYQIVAAQSYFNLDFDNDLILNMKANNEYYSTDKRFGFNLVQNQMFHVKHSSESL